MKKGDLVRRVRFSGNGELGSGSRAALLRESMKEFWKDPAIVVKGPYESVFSNELASGRPYSSVRMAVDVLYKGQIYEGIYIDDVERVVINHRQDSIE